jgi:hypothetical protein
MNSNIKAAPCIAASLLAAAIQRIEERCKRERDKKLLG